MLFTKYRIECPSDKKFEPMATNVRMHGLGGCETKIYVSPGMTYNKCKGYVARLKAGIKQQKPTKFFRLFW